MANKGYKAYALKTGFIAYFFDFEIRNAVRMKIIMTTP